MMVTAVITAVTFSFQSCGDDPAPEEEVTQQEVFIETLITSPAAPEGWSTDNGGSVVVDNTEDETEEWKDFKLKFEKYKYKTDGGKDGIWPASGTWEYADPERTDKIRRDDGVIMDTKVSGNTLTLKFTIKTQYTTGGRVSALGGEYEFVLK